MEPYGGSRAMWNPLLEHVAPACLRTRLNVLALATLCLLQRQERGRETVGIYPQEYLLLIGGLERQWVHRLANQSPGQ